MSTTAVEPDLALTRDDLTALRDADTVTLHLSEYGSYLRAYCRAYGEPSTFSRRQQVLYPEHHLTDTRMRTIACSASVNGYRGPESSGWHWQPGSERRTPTCFTSLYDDDLRRTIVGTLRVGDALHLGWTADNNNEIVRASGLHFDQVHLVVNPQTQQRRKYLLACSVGYDNSARMIRQLG